jgi:hypothetical protein
MQAVYGAPSSFDALAVVHEPRGGCLALGLAWTRAFPPTKRR